MSLEFECEVEVETAAAAAADADAAADAVADAAADADADAMTDAVQRASPRRTRRVVARRRRDEAGATLARPPGLAQLRRVMGAYNEVQVRGCPACHEQAVVRAQTHVASSFDGDASGRFCHRVYRLGEPMRWWPPAHPGHARWREGHEGKAADEAVECCYASCLACGAALFVLLRFAARVPVEVLASGLERDWPSGYLR